MPGGITPAASAPGNNQAALLAASLGACNVAIIDLGDTTRKASAALAEMGRATQASAAALRAALGAKRAPAATMADGLAKPASSGLADVFGGNSKAASRGLGDLQNAASQAAGMFGGVVTGAAQAAAGGLSALGGAVSGNLLGTVGGAATALAGIAVTGMAAVVAVKGLTSAAQGFASAAAPDGLKAVNDSFSILSGTIGTMMLPGFVLAGAVALTLADQLGQFVDSHSKEIAEWWKGWIPSAEDVADNITDFGSALTRIVPALVEAGQASWEMVMTIQTGCQTIRSALESFLPGPMIGRLLRDQIGSTISGLGNDLATIGARPYGEESARDRRQRQRDAAASGNADFVGPMPQSPTSEIAANARKIVDAMKANSFAGKIGYGDVASARDRIQEQNLMTELDRQRNIMMQKSIDILEKMLVKMQPAVGR